MYYNQTDIYRTNRKVVFYARVSTDHEAQISALENQIDWYKPIMNAHPEWELVGQYIDEGVTGTSAEKREAFMQMIADAKQHKFDLIITRGVSRFARNTVDTLQYTRELRRIGVEVFFLNDNIKTFDGDGELRLTIMATLAQDESRKTSIRVKSGQKTSMEKGVIYGNGNILGYKRVGKEMIIDPEQAKTVRLIFDLYIAGDGLTKIKYILESKGIKTAMGKTSWSATVISNILKNTFYYGLITYRKAYVQDYLTQKRVKNNGEIEFIQVLGTHTPIVTKEEFDKVQEIMKKRTKVINDHTERRRVCGLNDSKYVWGKLLLCSCGCKFNRQRFSSFGRRQVYSYICNKRRKDGSFTKREKLGLPIDNVCTSPSISEARLEITASYIFNKVLKKKNDIINLATEIVSKHIYDQLIKTTNEEEIQSLNQELARVKKKYDILIELRTDGEIDKETFKKKAKDLEDKKVDIQNRIDKLNISNNKKHTTSYNERLKLLKSKLSEYVAINADGNIPDSVVEAFFKRIIIYPDHQEWYLRVDSSSCESNDVLEIKNASILIDKIVLKRDYFISVIAKKGNVHHFKKAAWRDANIEIYL